MLTLFGCQKFLAITVDDEHSVQPVFKFYTGFFGLSKEVEISVFYVFKKSDESVVLWKIESQSLRPAPEPVPPPTRLKELKYGVAPDGFVTVIPAQPLKWGETYRVVSALEVSGMEAVVGAGGEFTPKEKSKSNK